MALTFNERLKTGPAQWDQTHTIISYGLRVALPGIIQSFDSEKQTVTVQPAIAELARTADSGFPTYQDLPLLTDVPIVLPRAGGFTLTVPVQAGDECLVVFADSCIDAWWQSGGSSNRQIGKRRHSLSDGFALLGAWSQPRKLQSYSTSAAQLRSDDGQTVVEVGSGQVTVKAENVTVTGSNNVSISGNGHTTIEGKDFLTHEHTLSSGTTGPVV